MTYNKSFMLYVWGVVIVYAIFCLLIGKAYRIWYAIGASPGLEILGRMSFNTAIPHEIGKYFLLLCYVLFGISTLDKRNKYARSKYQIGYVLMLVLVPSILVALVFNKFDLPHWIGEALGTFEIGLLLTFASKERWSYQEYITILKVSLLPAIPILVSSTLRTPKFSDLELTGASIESTTGGFGANQVSTYFGSAIFIIGLLLLLGKAPYRYIITNFAVLGYLLFRGLISFSRGGMVVSILAFLVSLGVYSFKNRKTLRTNILLLAFTLILGTIVFSIANKITGNLLSARYTGKKAGEAEFASSGDLNKITSNRAEIAYTDLRMFQDHILFGVGPGESKDLREKYGGFNIITHVEFTRLLSEHGLGGLFAIFILVVFPIYWVTNLKSIELMAISGGLYTLAIATTFHAAMRTNITPVYFLLASFIVQNPSFGLDNFTSGALAEPLPDSLSNNETQTN